MPCHKLVRKNTGYSKYKRVKCLLLLLSSLSSLLFVFYVSLRISAFYSLLSSIFKKIIIIIIYYLFFMPPEASVLFTIFSHQALKEKKSLLHRTYKLSIQYLPTDQILLSNSFNSCQKSPLKCFSYYFF